MSRWTHLEHAQESLILDDSNGSNLINRILHKTKHEHAHEQGHEHPLEHNH